MQLETESTDARYLVRRILFTVVWLPVQLTLSMIFATGGILIVLSLGVLLSPLLALVFLIRRAMRGSASGSAGGLMRMLSRTPGERAIVRGPDRPESGAEPEHDDGE